MKKSELRKIIRQVIKEQIGVAPTTAQVSMNPSAEMSTNTPTGGGTTIDFTNYQTFAASLGNNPLAALQQAGMSRAAIQKLEAKYRRETGGSLRGGRLNEKIWGAVKWLWKNRRWIGATLAGYVLGDGE